MSTLSERLRTGVDDPGIFDEAADELDRLTARVAELEKWSDVVFHRLHTWRQSLMNDDGDRLSLSDFMHQDALDDLIGHVCAALEHKHD